MSDKLYQVPPEWAARAYVRDTDYRAMYESSIADPEAFWAEQAQRIHWYRTPTTIKNTTFGPGEVEPLPGQRVPGLIRTHGNDVELHG